MEMELSREELLGYCLQKEFKPRFELEVLKKERFSVCSPSFFENLIRLVVNYGRKHSIGNAFHISLVGLFSIVLGYDIKSGVICVSMVLAPNSDPLLIYSTDYAVYILLQDRIGIQIDSRVDIAYIVGCIGICLEACDQELANGYAFGDGFTRLLMHEKVG
ncbi:MAG: hypothetical protein G01um101418_396 [Parcubacteria group bacterium Gr01-1014_18]|nr:MAG: hypothetical protein Greene041636_358 [Parcubacteria group bacterium Greene0416_36]TSC81117.1 MAG: hypothetical protein G01um101418_396 [Parcubacteria group bacterium Gr01-1014_18]TSC98467.1 MAG: hypothetical protein Greene101420_704 [Parcubacteria group bacterium Greene1014_20]TSD07368.1 MAG: hypothetical protein Greene07142_223 [Parcubacteria group bacterium Greene0714_2]